MADQQFCLRWNNHQSTLISVFDSLLERGAMVDCTLAAEGQCLQAHKVVLSACSPYLETLLSQHYDKHPILLLKDVKFYELQAMMDYMYRGEVNVAQDKLGMFLKAAESLQIKGLSDSGGNEPPDTGGGTSSKRTSKGAPVTNLPRGSGLTVERRRPQQPQAAQVVDIPSDSGSRDGSESPLRRKRPRRTSGGGDSAIEGETSNTGDVSRTQSSSAPLSSDQVPMNGSADSNALGILSSLMDGTVETDNSVQEPGPSLGSSSQTQPSLRIREKMEPSTTEMIQPKAEYLESEENVEDLTLDDDNVDTGMDAGPSQRQGSAYQWHMGDQGADEVFMAAQEAVGANRDAQGCITPQKHLWKFLLELLDNPEFSPRYIKWINRESNVFKLVDPRMVATLWGTHKNKPDMTYESMGRGLRYYYKRGILARAKCKGQSHTYKFEHIPVAEDGYIKNAVELHHLVRDFPLTDRRLNNSVAVPEVVHINEGDNSIDIQDNFKEEAL